MEPLLIQIGNFGFPIIVSVFLLVRIEKKLDELTFSIHELSTILRTQLQEK